MNASSKLTTGKKAIMFLLVAVLAAGIAFASPLAPKGSTEGIKVYDDSFRAASPSAIADGWVIRTINGQATFANEEFEIEVGEGSLLQIISLSDQALEVYLLDGNVIATSKSSDFTVRTTVTQYKAKAGTTIFVVSNDDSETSFVEAGIAKAENLITNANTEVEAGKCIDNSVSNYQPAEVSLEQFTASARPVMEVAEEPEVQLEEPAEKKADTLVSETGSYRRTINYYVFSATVDAYIGKAFIQYPSFVTDLELQTAAAAAYYKYSDLLEGVYFSIQEPGLAVVTYPETYGLEEFNYAMDLLEVELTAYLDEMFNEPAKPETKVEDVVAEQVQEVTVEPEAVETVEAVDEPVVEAEETAAETDETSVMTVEFVESEPAEVKQEPLKTSLETVTKEEAAASAASRKKVFTFGLDASVLYGAKNSTSSYVAPEALNKVLGTYLTSLSFDINPYVRIKNFTLGLHLSVDPYDIMKSFEFNTGSVLEATSSVMSYISKIGYENDSKSVRIFADRSQEVEFTSPVFRSMDRRFDGADNLTGIMDINAKGFRLYAFVDDMELRSMLADKDQYMGARASFNFKGFEIGAGAIANVGHGFDTAVFYPTADVKLPISIKGSKIEFTASAAAKTTANDITDIDGTVLKSGIDITYGAFSFGAAAALNNGDHLTAAINNAPVTVTTPANGQVLDIILNAGVNTKVFKFNTEFNLPVNHKGSGFLAKNAVTTRNGAAENLTADVLTLQGDLTLGKFTFSAGAIYNGLAGRVAKVAGSIFDSAERRNALMGLIDPEICTYYVIAGFNSKHVDVFGRLDYAEIDGDLTMPASVGLTVKF